jgi:hypothetical protein
VTDADAEVEEHIRVLLFARQVKAPQGAHLVDLGSETGRIEELEIEGSDLADIVYTVELASWHSYTWPEAA